jgi:alanyl aminopeptidase
LDDVARPTRYAARLKLIPTEDTFTGTIDVDLVLQKATAALWLNGSELVIREATMEMEGESIAASPIDGGKEFVGFAFHRPVGPGAGTLHVSYSGSVSARDSRGLFRQREGSDWYMISQFESYYARLAFPCFDEPSFKVPWQVTLEVREGDDAFSNTQVAWQRRTENGFKLVAFAETKPLPSYLVALGVGPFEVVEAGKAGRKATPLRIIVPRGRQSEAAYAAEVSPVILELLEKYLDIPYPYEKLDVLSIPLTTNFGAMENAGLVTASQTALLARRDEQSIGFRRRYAGLAAHEFGHMWFGDLVTTAWWDDIWLNEAFASWIGSKVIESWKPEWSHGASGIAGRIAAMGADSLESARKVRQPIESEHDIVNSFDGITYQKGAALLRMFERWVGEEAFRRGIHRYLENHAWGNATAQDFLAEISAASSRDIAPAFSTFLDQAGLPLVTASLQCERGIQPRVRLSQERYSRFGSRRVSPDQLWQIPVCVRYGSGKESSRECTLLTQKAAELELALARGCPAWLLANDGELGYYRVFYEGDLLARLLKENLRLSVPERMGVIDDIAALAAAGKLMYSEVLERVPAFAKDPHREIQGAAAEIVRALRANMIPETIRGGYARYIRQVFGENARRLGWKSKPGEDDDARLLRLALVPLVTDEGGDPVLQAEARRLARRWLRDRIDNDSDAIGGILQAAAAHGDRKLFEEFHGAAQKETNRRDRLRLLQALGSFRDPPIQKDALALVLSNEFDPREAMTIVWRASSEPKTRDLAYRFVKQNFDRLVERLPRDAGAGLAAAGGRYCDEEHRADVEGFFKDRVARFTGGPRNLARTLETISLCSELKRLQEPSVVAFFAHWKHRFARR